MGVPIAGTPALGQHNIDDGLASSIDAAAAMLISTGLQAIADGRGCDFTSANPPKPLSST